MKLLALDIPEEPAELRNWLEQQLVGMELGVLVAEMAAVHREARGRTMSLDEALGPVREQILNEGLSVLSPEAVTRLLTHPKLLLDLQEEVLSAGGEYWDRLEAASPKLDDILHRGRERLSRVSGSGAAEPPESPVRLQIAANRWYQRPALASLATAAAVLLAVGLFTLLASPEKSRVAQQPWGWNDPEVLDGEMPASDYLNGLADAADEWFHRRPTNPADVAARIVEFRKGCSQLILADHQPLAAQDRAWLVQRCRAWAKNLDEQLTSVEHGANPLDVRAQTDETVRNLIKALRDRAAKTVG